MTKRFLIHLRCTAFAALLVMGGLVNASDIKEVLPLTNRIIMLHFDDGSVTYPNTLNVVRLNITEAEKLSNYSITSADDAAFSSALNPSSIGRKTKGTEYTNNPPWGGNSSDPTGKPWAAEHWVYIELPAGKVLAPGKTYTVQTGTLAGNGSSWNFTFSTDYTAPRSEAVHVNTIGYAANAPKYGYVYQWMGSKGGLSLTSYAGKNFWVISSTGSVVKTGTLTFRKAADNAETAQADSPNKNFLNAEAYECNFSDVTANGTYRLVVEGIGGSYPFKIGKDALFEAYYKTMRGLYYQRSGIRLAAPYTDGTYLRPVNQNTKVTSDDGVSFAGKMFYSNIPFSSWTSENGGTANQSIINSTVGKPLDVAGWYHDAGDWDAYWTHQRIPILLMLTYEYAPERFADNELNIPESGNGIPDIIDEASWLVKFNYRLRKELKAKGYSDGGVGGARVCSDVFNADNSSAESNLPSWKENRRMVVSAADAYMTYIYAGEAAQFAIILKKLGKNPSSYPVEMLDKVNFADMAKDNVDWEKEAKEAFAWASDPKNQPVSGANYSNDLGAYRMYAAANLFRLTGMSEYHEAAKTELKKVAASIGIEDNRWGLFSYLLSDNQKNDATLFNNLKNTAISLANIRCFDAVDKRACRWGGVFDMPMLVGQGTTPWMFESIVAYKLGGGQKYADAVHTTADYFLGTNPLHFAWATKLGPRSPEVGFHLDVRYNNNWQPYPGIVPYGPWRLSDMVPFTWTIDGVSVQGGQGPWNKDWQNFSQQPLTAEWPGHERWCSNVHSPMAAEFTVHQNTVYAGLTYGFVNANDNSDLHGVIGITIPATLSLRNANDNAVLAATVAPINAKFAHLIWSSSDPAKVYVDNIGRVTALQANSSATITCKTLNGSVTATCEVTVGNEPILADSIVIINKTITLRKGGSGKPISVLFYPESVTDKSLTWTYDDTKLLIRNDSVFALEVVENSLVTAKTSNNKTATCKVSSTAPSKFIIADFDTKEYVTATCEPGKIQLFPAADVVKIANPAKDAINGTDECLQFNKPAASWKLFGFCFDKKKGAQYEKLEFKMYSASAGSCDLYMGDDLGRKTIALNAGWNDVSVDIPANYDFTTILFFPFPEQATAGAYIFDEFTLIERPGYEPLTSETSIMLDFEAPFALNWNPVGSYSWDSNVTALADNPAKSEANNSDKVFKWHKNGANNTWGGFGIKSTNATDGLYKGFNPADWDYVIVDIYSPQPFDKLTLKLAKPDGTDVDTDADVIGEFQYSVGVTANSWTRVKLPMSNLAIAAGSYIIQQVDIMPAGGLGEEFDIFVDNIGFEWNYKVLNTLNIGSNFTLKPEQTQQLSVEYNPVNSDEKAVEWLSDNTDVATVSQTGLVTAVSEGTAIITVKSTDNPAIYHSIEVTVEFNALVSLNIGSNFALTAAQTKQLVVVYNPANADEKTVEWLSGNTDVATVSQTGLVTAVAAGTTTITVKSIDNPAISHSIDVTVNNPVGLEAIGSSNVKLYPNPASSSVTITSDKGISLIEIYSISSVRLFAQTTSGETSIVLSNLTLQKGVYFVKTFDLNGNVTTLRLMIK